MNSKEFIIKCINEIITTFPYLHLKYEHDDFSCSHYLSVEPHFYYVSNEDYIEMEREISLLFIELFPNEILTFLSANSFYKIENPCYEKGYDSHQFDVYIDIEESKMEIFQDFDLKFPEVYESKLDCLDILEYDFNTELTNNSQSSIDSLEINHKSSLILEEHSNSPEIYSNFGLAA